MNGPLDFRLRPLPGNMDPDVPKLYPATMASSSFTANDGKISSKRPNKIWHKQEFEGGKSCQIMALLNVNTAIWQVFELVENRTVCWEIGLFWQVFHHCVASAIMNWIYITLTSEQEIFKLTFE